MSGGLIDVRLRGDIFELSTTKIVIEDVLRPGEATWAAHHWHAFPHARGTLTGSGSSGNIEINVVGDNQVEQPIAVVVYESAARTPGFPGSGNARFSAYFAKDAFLIVVQTTASVIGNV